VRPEVDRATMAGSLGKEGRVPRRYPAGRPEEVRARDAAVSVGRDAHGHARVYSITDVLARYARKRGFDVLHPFGWDAFGLPAENAAIKEGVHPAERTPRNIASFKEDVISLGMSVVWSTEITTADPEYYRWNLWFFLRMLQR